MSDETNMDATRVTLKSDVRLKAAAQQSGITDKMALDSFVLANASAYFNKASKNTRNKKQSRQFFRLAQTFRRAADVDTRLLKNSDAAPANVLEFRALKKVARWEDNESTLAEREALEKYAYSKIDDFIAKDPARWARIKQDLPATVAKISKVTGRKF